MTQDNRGPPDHLPRAVGAPAGSGNTATRMIDTPRKRWRHSSALDGTDGLMNSGWLARAWRSARRDREKVLVAQLTLFTVSVPLGLWLLHVPADVRARATYGSIFMAMGVLVARWAAARSEADLPVRTLTDRINALRSNLAASALLIEEINAEFELQTKAAERIRAEAEENRRLAALHKEEAKAVATLVERTQARAARLAGRQQWLFFLAGLLFAVPLGVAGNFAFELVKAWLSR